MSAIVKANSNLTNGGLAVLSSSFTTNDNGRAVYSVKFCCLKQFSQRWISTFKSGNIPPTPLPDYITASTALTKTPTLFDVAIETSNGLTYIDAQYGAGTVTDIVETVSSEQRSLAYSFAEGDQIIQASFDYISYSITRSSTNVDIRQRKGSVGAVFNCINCKAKLIRSGKDPNVKKTTVRSRSETKQQNGEYTISITSTGIYIDKLGVLNDAITPTTDVEDAVAEPVWPRRWRVYPLGTSW